MADALMAFNDALMEDEALMKMADALMVDEALMAYQGLLVKLDSKYIFNYNKKHFGTLPPNALLLSALLPRFALRSARHIQSGYNK